MEADSYDLKECGRCAYNDCIVSSLCQCLAVGRTEVECCTPHANKDHQVAFLRHFKPEFLHLHRRSYFFWWVRPDQVVRLDFEQLQYPVQPENEQIFSSRTKRHRRHASSKVSSHWQTHSFFTRTCRLGVVVPYLLCLDCLGNYIANVLRRERVKGDIWW